MPTAIIADDEDNLRIHLRELLAASWPELQVLAEAANGLEALDAVQEHMPDVAFLDIKMPGLSGLQVGMQAPKGTRLVFVTAYDEFAVQAFEQQAVDYLLKPVNAERLGQTVARLNASLAQTAPAIDAAVLQRLLAQLQGTGSAAVQRLRYLRASRGDATYQVPVEDVLYFMSDNKYTAVHTAQHEYLIRTPLAELLEQLDTEAFWQIHRSTVVAARHVLSTQRNMSGGMDLRLKGVAKPLAVARAYQPRFKQM